MPETPESNSIFQKLRAMEVFRHLADHQIELLDSWGIPESRLPGGVAFDRDNGEDFAVLLDGLVDVVYPTPVGDQIVSHLKPGDLVGEIAYVDGMGRSGVVRVRTPAKLLRFPAAEVLHFSRRHPGFAQALLRTFWLSLAVKLRQSMQFMDQIMEAKPEGKSLVLPARPEDVDLDTSDKIAILSEQKVSALDLKQLAHIFHAERYPEEALIFSEGDSGNSLFVVAEGCVRISRRLEHMGEEALAILPRGEIFGEMALVDDRPRSADAHAHGGPCTVLEVDHGALEDLFSQQSEVCRSFLELFCRIICQRIRNMNEQLVAWKVMAGFS